ncbi:ABC transporter permease [soil metagenome]
MTAEAPPVRLIRARRSRIESSWRALKKAPISAWFGMVVIALYLFAAIFAPLIAPYGEAEIVGKAYQLGTAEFWLGTDQIGRDLLSRLIYGARNTIGIALVTTLLSFIIGGTLGVFASIMRGWFDQILSRLVDALMSIPVLIFALMLLAVFGKNVVNLVLILAALDSTRVFRLSRATAMNVVVMDYVEAAKLRGEGLAWIMFKEILPNILPTLIAEFGLRFCFVFLTISALSFLGVGIQPPTADWGSMVAENKSLITYGRSTPLLPAGAIALLTVAVNFVVDWFLHKTSGLRDEH